MTQATAFPAPEPLPEQDQRLVVLYVKEGIPLDELAYTDAFDRIHSTVLANGDKRTKHEVFKRLLTLRKSGRLPRIGHWSS